MVEIPAVREKLSESVLHILVDEYQGYKQRYRLK